MRIKHIPFGPFVNESEKQAVGFLKARLESDQNTGKWLLLSNISLSTGYDKNLPKEVDILAIGSSGVFVIEVKHWNASSLDDLSKTQKEAENLNQKAKIVKGKLKHLNNIINDNFFVSGKFLLTKNEKEKFKEKNGQRRVNGIEVFGLQEWRELMELSNKNVFTEKQIDYICNSLCPNLISIDSSHLTKFADYINLAEIKPQSTEFRRVFKAQKKMSRDKAILVIFDLSASKDKNPMEIANREFEVIKRLQKSPYVPNILDSFQESSTHPGEICFFSYSDPESPSLIEKAKDTGWSFSERIQFSINCMNALKSFHSSEPDPILHRYISPDTIKVKGKESPVFTQFHCAKISGITTIAGSQVLKFNDLENYVAPEVTSMGLACCSKESDIYSLCASLSVVFQNNEETLYKEALHLFEKGLAKDPSVRDNIDSLIKQLEEIHKEPKEPLEEEEKPLQVRFWDESTIQELNSKFYRIISHLGSGSVGSTFKVMELDSDKKVEISGPFVAKAITNEQIGEQARKAYAKVRAQTGQNTLAGVLEVANVWEKNKLTALLRWIEGQPLSELKEILPLYIEELGEMQVEKCILDWIQDLCKGLAHLHQANLVHGDVSPKNILVQELDVKLTDFDLSAENCSKPIGGTPAYSSPEVDQRLCLTFSDDIYALAATFFDVLFDRDPFSYNGIMAKERGLCWKEEEKKEYPGLAKFLDKATSPNLKERFSSAMEAIDYLNNLQNPSIEEPAALIADFSASVLSENNVPRLFNILQSFPSSPKGNAETRGLDTEFSNSTYVETELDKSVKDGILNRNKKLVILCGNAGDGKTAFLQNLARSLGVSEYHSSKRIWETTTSNGIKIYANMDGAASLEQSSAEDLLNEFFSPFRDGKFPENEVRLIAINDGPLLAWLEQQETTGTWLTGQLEYALNNQDYSKLDSQICFINFNYRSLVGGLKNGGEDLNIDFLEKLIKQIIGSPNEWDPCKSCISQNRCTVFHSISMLLDSEKSNKIIKKIARVFQAVHLKGNLHITARSLRAALSYIFFGWHDCNDLHSDPKIEPVKYWDRIFDSNSEFRQGELLESISAVDPALESQPQIDKTLLKIIAKNDSQNTDPQTSFDSLRRKAYFEGLGNEYDSNEALAQIIDIYHGKHIEKFLKVSTGTPDEVLIICEELCEGIARLEELPDNAFIKGQIPLRITPRTPTETIFWVNKPQGNFILQPQQILLNESIDFLHNQVVLKYKFENGYFEELAIGADLFQLLMDVRDGYQLSGRSFDDIFANLSIFKQRLAQEEETVLFAFNPMDENVFKIAIDYTEGRQTIILKKFDNKGAEIA